MTGEEHLYTSTYSIHRDFGRLGEKIFICPLFVMPTSLNMVGVLTHQTSCQLLIQVLKLTSGIRMHISGDLIISKAPAHGMSKVGKVKLLTVQIV